MTGCLTALLHGGLRTGGMYGVRSKTNPSLSLSECSIGFAKEKNKQKIFGNKHSESIAYAIHCPLPTGTIYVHG